MCTKARKLPPSFGPNSGHNSPSSQLSNKRYCKIVSNVSGLVLGILAKFQDPELDRKAGESIRLASTKSHRNRSTGSQHMLQTSAVLQLGQEE